MNRISAVIITFNEEKNIKRCLDSIIDIADEIVVVDSFSTDKTEEICVKYGVRFIKNKFDGHIQQKNFAIGQAKYSHILSLDADEALSEKLKKSVLEAKNNWLADAYEMNRITNYCGKWIKHCGWYPDIKLRLMDRTKGKWGGINPHDKYIMNNDAKIMKLRGDILHYSFYTIYQHMQTVNSFSEIAAQRKFAKGIKTNLLIILFKPIFEFLKMYFIRLGILDGFYGFIICVNSAHSTFLKQIKLRDMSKKG